MENPIEKLFSGIRPPPSPPLSLQTFLCLLILKGGRDCEYYWIGIKLFGRHLFIYIRVCMYNCTYSHCYSIYYFISKSLFLWPPSSPYNETKALIINTWRIEVSLSQPRFGLPIKIEVPIYLNKHHVWVWFYSMDDWICI